MNVRRRRQDRIVMKRCNTCRQELPLHAFSVRQASPEGLQNRCKACWRVDYVTNREERKRVAAKNARVTERRHREKLAAYLREHPCVDCGETDIRCLDFDHREPGEKLMNVTKLVAIHAAWARVAAEIEKCDVRCASCHRKRTASVMNDWRHQRWAVEATDASAAATQRLQRLFA